MPVFKVTIVILSNVPSHRVLSRAMNKRFSLSFCSTCTYIADLHLDVCVRACVRIKESEKLENIDVRDVKIERRDKGQERRTR